MKFLVKNVLVLDKKSPHYKKKIDFEVEHGIIVKIGKSLPPIKSGKTIQGKKMILSPSFIDINAGSGEPSRLEAETLDSLIKVAAVGGFCYVAHIPTKEKPTQTKSDISFLQSKNKESICQILPIGNITKTGDENTISSIMDMWEAGAVAFSDGNELTPKTNTLKNILLYSKGFEGRIMIHPEKKELSKNGQVNQGIMSLKLGFKGIPKDAEIMAVSEIIQLAQYTDTPILFLNINTPESLQLIANANKVRKQFHTSTGSLNLRFDETDLLDYNTSFKLNPPLRAKKDKDKLIKSILTGKLDIIYSQHTPCTPEEKSLEFDLANYGAVNIQTSAQVCIEALGTENIEKSIELMSTNPAQYFGIDLPAFEQGSRGSFTLLDLDCPNTFDKKSNVSKSINSPLLGTNFKTKIIGLISNQKELFF